MTFVDSVSEMELAYSFVRDPTTVKIAQTYFATLLILGQVAFHDLHSPLGGDHESFTFGGGLTLFIGQLPLLNLDAIFLCELQKSVVI